MEQTKLPLVTDWRIAAAEEFTRAREALVAERDAAMRDMELAHERLKAVLERLRDCNARIHALDLPMVLTPTSARVIEVPADTAEGAGRTAREIILAALRDSFPEPLEAKELREIIEAEKGHPIHYKTPGMSLYRLANDGLVRRAGRKWFYAGDDAQPQQEEDDMSKMIG